MTTDFGNGAVSPDLTTGDQSFDGYTAAFERGDAPLLGHLVLYSIYESPVTPEDVERWLGELGLSRELAPAPLRAEDAFERVTGPNGVRMSYPLDDPAAALEPKKRRDRREAGQKALLMVRHVSRGKDTIVKHIVREVRDADAKQLKYDSRLGVCEFVRERKGGALPGAGAMRVVADELAIAQLPPAEQDVVRAMLFDLEAEWKRRCTFLSADRLRGMVRDDVESLNGIRVRESGGVYFVHRIHAQPLAALRALVNKFGEQNKLTRIPLPDQEEMREMVVAAVTTKASQDLNALARDIADAQRSGKGAAVVEALYQRFRDLKAATQRHTELLSTSLDEADASLQLVNEQLVALLTSAGDE